MESKAPAVAMALQAVFPAGGYVYLGRIENAFAALVGWLFLGTAGAVILLSGEPVRMVAGSLILLGLWLGLIVDAGRLARRTRLEAGPGQTAATSLMSGIAADSPPPTPRVHSMHRRERLKCPRCLRVSEFRDRQPKVCWNCGFGKRSPAPRPTAPLKTGSREATPGPTMPRPRFERGSGGPQPPRISKLPHRGR